MLSHRSRTKELIGLREGGEITSAALQVVFGAGRAPNVSVDTCFCLF